MLGAEDQSAVLSICAINELYRAQVWLPLRFQNPSVGRHPLCAKVGKFREFHVLPYLILTRREYHYYRRESSEMGHLSRQMD